MSGSIECLNCNSFHPVNECVLTPLLVNFCENCKNYHRINGECIFNVSEFIEVINMD